MYYNLFLFLIFFIIFSCRDISINQTNYDKTNSDYVEVLRDQNNFKKKQETILKQEVVIKPKINEPNSYSSIDNIIINEELKYPVGIFLKSFILLEDKSCKDSSFKIERLVVKNNDVELDFLKSFHSNSEITNINKKDPYLFNLMLVADPMQVFTKQMELKILISFRVETESLFDSTFNIKNKNPMIVLFGENPSEVLRINLGEDNCVGELKIHLGQAVQSSSFSNTWTIQGMD